MNLPHLIRVYQSFPPTKLEDVEGEVQSQLAGCGVIVKAGSHIAIGTGSRGIANIARMVRGVVQWVRSHGGEFFIVPAMASHGGAIAWGQRRVLERYGITEEYTGAPIRSSMNVVTLPQGGLGIALFFDEYAHHADGCVLMNCSCRPPF